VVVQQEVVVQEVMVQQVTLLRPPLQEVVVQ
jgi:hypothetical protein